MDNIKVVYKPRKERCDKLPELERIQRLSIAKQKYEKSKKGKNTRAKYIKTKCSKKASNAYHIKMRSNYEYRKWESLMTSARREARETGRETKDVASEWGVLPWKEWIWSFVDYSKHDIIE